MIKGPYWLHCKQYSCFYLDSEIKIYTLLFHNQKLVSPHFWNWSSFFFQEKNKFRDHAI
jgi:hypothetical protein